jgi:hypothetical protein
VRAFWVAELVRELWRGFSRQENHEVPLGAPGFITARTVAVTFSSLGFLAKKGEAFSLELLASPAPFLRRKGPSALY